MSTSRSPSVCSKPETKATCSATTTPSPTALRAGGGPIEGHIDMVSGEASHGRGIESAAGNSGARATIGLPSRATRPGLQPARGAITRDAAFRSVDLEPMLIGRLIRTGCVQLQSMGTARAATRAGPGATGGVAGLADGSVGFLDSTSEGQACASSRPAAAHRRCVPNARSRQFTN